MSAVLCPSAEKRERGLAFLRQRMDLQGQATQPAAGQMYREGFLAALRGMGMAPLQGPSSIPPSALGQQVRKLRDRHAQTQDRLTHTHTLIHTHTHTYTHMHTYAFAHIHTHSRTHTARARKHRHTHTHTHTHAQAWVVAGVVGVVPKVLQLLGTSPALWHVQWVFHLYSFVCVCLSLN